MIIVSLLLLMKESKYTKKEILKITCMLLLRDVLNNIRKNQHHIMKKLL
jgi:hypothetical protein